MGNGFVQYLEEFAPIHRGSRQAGSINWLMGMGRRRAGAGLEGARVMLSAEPLTHTGGGYPNHHATGELCDGARHPESGGRNGGHEQGRTAATQRMALH